MQVLWQYTPAETVPSIWEDVHGCNKMGHFQKVCRSRRVRAVNEVEQETIQDGTDEDIKLVR